MFGHAPGTTLFPYTTLFRSRDGLVEEGVMVRVAVAEDEALLAVGGVPVHHAHAALAGDLADQALDRKSTRLNSSHPSISYAVFCLKKKKTFFHLFFFCY